MAKPGPGKPSLRILSTDKRKMHASLRTIFYGILGTSMLIFILTFFDLTVSTESRSPLRPLNLPKGMDVDLRRDIARDLRNAFHDLKRSKDYNQAPTTHTLLQIERILGRLDPRTLPLEVPDVTQMDQLLLNNKTGLLEVCPEHYKGHDLDDNYYSSSFVSECSNKMPLKDLVSIAIDATDYKDFVLDTLLSSINDKYKGITVYVGLSSRKLEHITKRFKFAINIRVTSSTPPPIRWGRILNRVTTKYVLIGYKMVAFSSYTDIERLVRIILQVPNIAYVSGATRNDTGYWTMECYQARLELYGLALREGYTSSSEECMYCDVINGPFLTSTSLLESLPLDPSLPEPVMFVDWFLRARSNDLMGMSCPDVLFFTKGFMKRSLNDHPSWLKLAFKLGVTDIYLPARNIHHFTCEEVNFKCMESKPYLAYPPCCVARLSRALRDAITVFDKTAINVHISSNTVVGGVKGGMQPWDDYAYITAGDSLQEVSEAISELRRRGFTVDHRHDSKVYYLHAYGRTINLTVQPLDLQGDLPMIDRETPTRIYVGNGWVPAPPNPGLYARGLQGRGSLQHRPLEGSWPRCMEPSHHGCLDHLPLDGSWGRLR